MTRPGSDPEELASEAQWWARARLVRPDATPWDWTADGGEAVALYRRADTVPVETDADLDATSAAPRESREPGVYDYWGRDESDPEGGG